MGWLFKTVVTGLSNEKNKDNDNNWKKKEVIDYCQNLECLKCDFRMRNYNSVLCFSHLNKNKTKFSYAAKKLYRNILIVLKDTCICQRASQVAQSVKNPPSMQKASPNAGDLGSVHGSGRSSGEGNNNHSSILVWKSPWTEKPGRLQSMGSQESDTT